MRIERRRLPVTAEVADPPALLLQVTLLGCLILLPVKVHVPAVADAVMAMLKRLVVPMR